MEPYDSILSTLRFLVRGNTLDLESLAGDILLEHMERGIELTMVYIRFRAYDALRRVQRERRMLETVYYVPASRPELRSSKEKERLDKLSWMMKKADLSSNEQLAIYEHFWLKEKITTPLSLSSALAKLRKIAREEELGEEQ